MRTRLSFAVTPARARASRQKDRRSLRAKVEVGKLLILLLSVLLIRALDVKAGHDAKMFGVKGMQRVAEPERRRRNKAIQEPNPLREMERAIPLQGGAGIPTFDLENINPCQVFECRALLLRTVTAAE